MLNIGERNDINEEKSFMEFNTICFDIANFMAKSNNESYNRMRKYCSSRNAKLFNRKVCREYDSKKY